MRSSRVSANPIILYANRPSVPKRGVPRDFAVMATRIAARKEKSCKQDITGRGCKVWEARGQCKKEKQTEALKKKHGASGRALFAGPQ